MKLSTKDLALICVLAAVYYITSILPGVPIIGAPEPKIELEATMASVFGVIAGPYLGFLAGFLGAILAWTLPPGSASITSAPFLLNPAINALTTGLMLQSTKVSSKFKNTRGWLIAFVILGILNAAFWFTPASQPISQYSYVAVLATFDKVIAWLLILPVVKFAERLSSSQRGLFTFFFLLAFIGNQADSALGVLVFALPPVYAGIFQLSVDVVRGLYLISPFYYPIVRLSQALIATFIIVPLVRALKEREWPI